MFTPKYSTQKRHDYKLALYLQNTDTTFAIINECVTFCCLCEKQVKSKK